MAVHRNKHDALEFAEELVRIRNSELEDSNNRMRSMFDFDCFVPYMTQKRADALAYEDYEIPCREWYWSNRRSHIRMRGIEAGMELNLKREKEKHKKRKKMKN